MLARLQCCSCKCGILVCSYTTRKSSLVLQQLPFYSSTAEIKNYIKMPTIASSLKRSSKKKVAAKRLPVRKLSAKSASLLRRWHFFRRTGRNLRRLRLELAAPAFAVMVSGEKKEEFREFKSHWTKRLENGAGKLQKFDVVEFRNGYGDDKPLIVIAINRIRLNAGTAISRLYSNGLSIEIPKTRKTYVIELGAVLYRKNCGKYGYN
ncbi:unnamed protein product [Amoebophrya sp. A25]|nr:unnamed protein product [Amoebophrya sp. A25]|eukprot:GSA25T00007115001.1